MSVLWSLQLLGEGGRRGTGGALQQRLYSNARRPSGDCNNDGDQRSRDSGQQICRLDKRICRRTDFLFAERLSNHHPPSPGIRRKRTHFAQRLLCAARFSDSSAGDPVFGHIGNAGGKWHDSFRLAIAACRAVLLCQLCRSLMGNRTLLVSGGRGALLSAMAGVVDRLSACEMAGGQVSSLRFSYAHCGWQWPICTCLAACFKILRTEISIPI